MSGDLLEQATRALRETSAEPQPRSGLTRAHLLDSAEKRYAGRRAGLLRWVVALVAVLAASTALARVAHYWPEIKRAIAADSGEQSDAAVTKKQAGATKKRPAQPLAAGSALQPAAADTAALEERATRPAELLAPPEDAVVASAGAPAPSAKPLAPPTRRSKPNARGPKVVAREQPAPVVAAPEPVTEVAPAPATSPAAVLAPKLEPEAAELALFRRAQRLHLNRDRRALAAWDDYLRVASNGALAPEANYNRALCLIRLGRKSEARIALTPFATGSYGKFRRAEAQSLIEALERETE